MRKRVPYTTLLHGVIVESDAVIKIIYHHLCLQQLYLSAGLLEHLVGSTIQKEWMRAVGLISNSVSKVANQDMRSLT